MLEVAVIGGEEIELVIAPALVSDPLAKDHDPQLQLPHFNLSLSWVWKQVSSGATAAQCFCAATAARTPVHWEHG
ncbi:MAG: hypothetical protein ACLQU2_17210, partial [Candidatus Binataceae bacterium]